MDSSTSTEGPGATMKMVVAIISNKRLDEVRQALLSAQIAHMTVSRVTGHGRLRDAEFYRGVEFVPDLTPKIRVEIIVSASEVNLVIHTIIASVRNDQDEGQIFVMSIEDAVNIRTGDHGIDAL
jgi:nitrogen regulatory protein PII